MVMTFNFGQTTQYGGAFNVTSANQDGYTTGKGMGLGLGGAKRRSNEFSIRSQPGDGTKVVIARWK